MKTLTLIEKNTKYNIQAGAEESRHSTLPMSNGLEHSCWKIINFSNGLVAGTTFRSRATAHSRNRSQQAEN